MNYYHSHVKDQKKIIPSFLNSKQDLTIESTKCIKHQMSDCLHTLIRKKRHFFEKNLTFCIKKLESIDSSFSVYSKYSLIPQTNLQY